MIVITLFVFPLLLDGVGRGEGLVLLLLLVVYVAFTFMAADDEIKEILDEVEDLAAEPEEGPRLVRNLGLVVAGGAGLGFGGWAIVEGAEYLTLVFGMSESLVGFTIVALGTSLPELITSIVAAVRRQADIAVGNVVGSNIFNLTAVMGGAAVVRGFEVDEKVLTLEFPGGSAPVGRPLAGRDHRQGSAEGRRRLPPSGLPWLRDLAQPWAVRTLPPA